MDASGISDQELISRLMSKVSEQALELGDLTNQLDKSRQILLEETSRSSVQARGSNGNTLNLSTGLSTSGAATQRRQEKDINQQILATQRQLEATESKLAENIKNKKRLMQDLESKTRESNFYLKKCQTLQAENQQLKQQVEQTLKMNSITAKQKGSSFPLKQIDSITHYKVCDDLKEAKSLLEKAKNELEAAKERESQSLLRVKVLEEALEFRSEEIGLAGHADLLAKVAKLRGEANALKSELSSKHAQVSTLEGDKDDMTNRHEALQKHVAALQNRLSQSQQDMYRLSNGDMIDMLKAAEAERDKLLIFIQNDMHTSTALGKQVEKLENDLRSATSKSCSADQTIASLTNELTLEKERIKRLSEQGKENEIQIKELQHMNQLLGAEKSALTTQFDRKSTESDELNKMQMNLFVQNKSKEEELMKKTDEILQLQVKLREWELSAPGMKAENERLQERLKYAQDEVSILRESVGVMEPKLARLEPELNHLRQERGKWDQERRDVEMELEQLRPLGRHLNEISRELQQLNELSDASTTMMAASASASASTSPSSTSVNPGNHKTSKERTSPVREPTAAVVAVDNVRDSTGISLSQRHSLWVGLPSIRNLNLTLYENIRRLASDLNLKEIQCNELQSSVLQKQQELVHQNQSNDAQWVQLSKQQEAATFTIQRLSELVKSTEAELSLLRSNRITVDQIRTVLASYPGSFAELHIDDLLASHPGSMNAGAEVHVGSIYSNEEKSAAQVEDAAGAAGRSVQNKEAVELMLKKVSDHALPDLIGRALMHNSAAVFELANTDRKLQAVEEKHAALLATHGELQQKNQELEHRLQESHRRTSDQEQQLDKVQRDCYNQVDVATELAEKQNALAMTLEAKIEKLHRDRQLKTAQVTAFQQREASIKSRLHTSLHDYSVKVGAVGLGPVPNLDTSKLIDVVHYTTEVLRTMATRAQRLSASHVGHVGFPVPSATSSSSSSGSSSSGSGGRVHGAPAAAVGAVSSRGLHSTYPIVSSSSTGPDGEVLSQSHYYDTGGAVGGTTGSGGGGVYGDGAGDDIASVTGVSTDIRSRLSPASQQFVHEASAGGGRLSSSSSNISRNERRLPSPMLTRPASSTTTAVPSRSIGGGGGSGRSSSSSSSSIGTNSSATSARTQALQDRLKQAQLAFSAMREAHSH